MPCACAAENVHFCKTCCDSKNIRLLGEGSSSGWTDAAPGEPVRAGESRWRYCTLLVWWLSDGGSGLASARHVSPELSHLTDELSAGNDVINSSTADIFV
ncbi:hypothetical protein J6590_021658 [Homalodisca vitripennis]|nr:hypothetical protein J6590_021658 [Homalodisca vitripennis]